MSATKWSLDPSHSELGFKIKHLMISNVSGKFTKFDVEAETENNDFTLAKLVANIDVASIDTSNEQRDAHLRNADFFSVEAHPTMKFVSTGVEKLDDETYNLYGDLTIKDTTKPVKLSVEHSGVATDPWGNVKAGFSISGKINRKDWGINYNAALETGGVMLGEELKIQGEVQLVKQAS
ncbi:YceI family protein [Adhaeribacter rhizoryzae]|uniref:Polyisoprenoid-binding protein n=1 Tax=Adhaeribacter rhizoryzae TaxID=2607907 RepID=A0A5M6DQM0_9BACT|nr:YceI family protein [Adhaeribacter rhizoryzae]KAA5547765.1 polyisoprenoid-binding protein [Adhaeribacter rhizoryzae]